MSIGRSSVHDTITIRPFEDRDLEAVLDVLKRALGESPLRRTPQLFAWKHFDNPFGRSIILVAESDGRIAGVRALMRWELLSPEGRVIRCVRAVDTATDPDFLRRGIFRAVTEKAVAVARAEGIEMIFNTPNDKSGKGYLSMGWHKVGSVGVFARFRLRHLAERSTTNEPPGADLMVPEGTPVAIDQWRDREPQGLRTARSRPYLQWRFTQHPTARYVQLARGEGAAILRPNQRSGRKELVVSDLFGADPAPAVRAAARQARAAYLVSWFSKGTPERAALLRSGLFPVPTVTALTLMARPLVDLDVEFGSLAAWDLALSDLELL